MARQVVGTTLRLVLLGIFTDVELTGPAKDSLRDKKMNGYNVSASVYKRSIGIEHNLAIHAP